MNQRYQEELLDHLSKAVKQVQMGLISKEDEKTPGSCEPKITNDSPSGTILFSCLEMIFSHGLRNKDNGIWPVVQYFCRNDVIKRIKGLRHVMTNRGRGRAWIFLALNEKELEGYLQSFQMDLEQMYKYYHMSALICGDQVPLLQTLISGLDFVNFKLILDVPYLDNSIRCGKKLTLSRSLSGGTQENKDHGSVVHINSSAISKTGQRAMGYVKDIFSHESSTLVVGRKSMQNVNTRTLVAVNHNPIKPKIYCPDCHKQSELVCLCVKKKAKAVHLSASSESAKLLESVFSNDDCKGSDAKEVNVPYSKQRFNPFDIESRAAKNESNPRRFGQEIPVLDTPIEVIRKPVRRRKRYSDTESSNFSTNSEDICRMRKLSGLSEENMEFPKRPGSMSDLQLSNPLIGFDPVVTSSEDDVYDTTGSSSVFPTDLHYDATPGTCGVIKSSQGVNELCNNQLILADTNKLECVVSSQGSLTSDNIGNSVVSYTGDETSSSSSLIVENLQNIMDISEDSTLDGNKNNVKARCDTVEHIENTTSMSENNVGDSAQEEKQSVGSLDGSVECGNGDCKTDTDSGLEDSEQHASNNLSRHDVRVSDDDSTTAENKDFNIDRNNLNKSDTPQGGVMSPEKKLIVEKRGMRRYRSESEQLLNALTLKEVERLRAEIQDKLKPSRDRLERVRKSIAEKHQISGSFQPDSSFMLRDDTDSETSSRPLFDDSSDDVTEKYSASSISQDGDSLSKSKPAASVSSLKSNSASSLPTMFVSDKTPLDISPTITVSSHKAVAEIDNTLRLYLMLEILNNETEEIIQMFHVSTGHSEGNWTALYLLFTDSFIYFLRTGDGNCPYQIEHRVSYEDLDYAFVGYNDQTIEFVFYKTKSPSTKSGKKSRPKIRAKLLVDAADKDLTDLIINVLKKTILLFTRRLQSIIKVCPPVFHDAKEHQISLIKYLRSEGLTGDIQLYQLVHWEDPDFVAGANMTKISLFGTLKYKAQTFWGSSWRAAYFVLSGGVLYQYASKDKEKPETSYQLTGNNCIGCKRVRSHQSPSPGLEFEIDFKNDVKLELCGYSDIEVTEWLQCLCMIVALDQASTIDREAHTDGMVMNMLNHDALVPCSLIVGDETLLLCHEDQHTGFCRTLAKARRQDISIVNIDKNKSFVCEVIIKFESEKPQSAKWGIFFPEKRPLEVFMNVLYSFSKVPTIVDKSEDTHLAHYLEARTLLDNQWSRTDSLLKGRSGSAENYTFI